LNPIDTIIVGSGIISILKAIELSKKGENVIIIEKKKNLGGVWAQIKLPGTNIICDYGIHYLLPNKLSEQYFCKYLKNDYLTIKGQFNVNVSKLNKLKLIERKIKSKYFREGSLTLEKLVKKKLLKSNVKIIFNNEVKKVLIDYKKKNKYKKCKVVTSENIFFAKKTILTSGVIIPDITDNKKFVSHDISNLIRIRPQLYLIFNGKINTKYKQLIFKKHKEIKYIHNITDYSKGLAPDNQLFLTSFYKIGYDSEKIVKKNLTELGVISNKSKIIYVHAICPILSFTDVNKMNQLSKRSNFLVEFMDTENFTESIGKLFINKNND
jgi:phytoene dehydrogenase-like protein